MLLKFYLRANVCIKLINLTYGCPPRGLMNTAYVAISRWLIKDLSDFPLCMEPLCSRALILHKDVFVG